MDTLCWLEPDSLCCVFSLFSLESYEYFLGVGAIEDRAVVLTPLSQMFYPVSLC